MLHRQRNDPLVPNRGALATAVESLLRYAPFPCHLVLLGESGVGKTTFARLVHARSHVAAGPFETVNLAGLDDDLANSELMGHERGAFTGAYARQHGAFERANGGTLFLDEVGKLSIPIQKKILTVIEDGMVRRLGGARDLHVDVRHIFAANESLEALVLEGKLLPEFEARLQFQRIRIPSLRERVEDIPSLFEQLLHLHAPRYGYPTRAPAATEALVKRLQGFRWPGNVRALENLAIRLLQDARGALELTVDLLTEELASYCGPALHEACAGTSRRDEVLGAILESRGVIAHAALRLGCSRSTLYVWMHELGITPSDYSRRTA